MRRVATITAVLALAFAGLVGSPGRAAALEIGQWHYNPSTGNWYVQLNGPNWTDAEAIAVRYGGHLVTINDQDEQDWLTAAFPEQGLSIGMNDLDTEGVWVWVSGDPVTYTNWISGEPNDWADGEDIAVMNADGGGAWNDLPDNDRSILEVPQPFPGNDDFADAFDVPDTFDDSPAMSGATLEPDEPLACDTGTIEGSAWYRFSVPALSTLSVTIYGDQDRVTAAIYGPFDGAPGGFTDLAGADRGCVYGVGDDATWIEGVERGTYLVQLASTHEWENAPAIHLRYGFAQFWIDPGSVSIDAATVDRMGNVDLSGTAVCELQWWSGFPEAPFNWTGDNEGFYSYELQGWVTQPIGRKTLLQGGAGGFIDCTSADDGGRFTWHLWSRAENGKFGPNWTNVDLTFGLNQCDETGCWFAGVSSFYDYTKLAKDR